MRSPLASGMRTVRIGPCVLDLHAEVLRDGSGTLVPLRAQAWRLLRLLAERRGSVVTKDDLLDAIWPGVVVTDASIARAVSDVRMLIGDTDHTIVRTVAKRGYMLAADDAAGERLDRLPSGPPTLFGRQADLEAIAAMLREHRLVTLVGGAGFGKTSAALAAARLHRTACGREIVFVDLAAVHDASTLPRVLAQALDLPVAQHGDPLPGVLFGMRRMDLLLLLDNAEHVVDAVSALVRRVLDAAPRVTLLVTSQAPLHVDEERVYRLDALAMPADDARWQDAVRASAVAMFVDRAKAADHRFEVDEHGVPAIVRICRALDGVPLALRMAAARVQLFGVEGLEARLSERLATLSGDRRDAPAKQQSLLAALDWSFGLLDPGEQALFLQLGTFVGGFSLDLAIEAMRGAVDDPALAVTRRLASLVERGLVDRLPGEPPRFRLLETQRLYALRRLQAEPGREHEARQRHADAVSVVMMRCDRDAWSLPDDEWLPRWRPELDNARAALAWAAVHHPERCAELVGRASMLLRYHGFAYEVRQAAECLDADRVAAMRPATQALFWHTQARLGLVNSARIGYDCARRGAEAARACGDRDLSFRCLSQQVSSACVPAAEAQAMLDEARRLHDSNWNPRVLSYLSAAEHGVARAASDWPAALRAAEAGVGHGRRAGARATTTQYAGFVLDALLAMNRIDDARRYADEMAAEVRSGPADVAPAFIGGRAMVAIRKGDVVAAKVHLREMFDLCRMLQWNYFRYYCCLYIEVALVEQRHEAACRLLGYAEPLMPMLKDWNVSTDVCREARALLAPLLDDARFEALIDEGRRLDCEQVCVLTLGDAPALETDSTLSARPGPSGSS